MSNNIFFNGISKEQLGEGVVLSDSVKITIEDAFLLSGDDIDFLVGTMRKFSVKPKVIKKIAFSNDELTSSLVKASTHKEKQIEAIKRYVHIINFVVKCSAAIAVAYLLSKILVGILKPYFIGR